MAMIPETRVGLYIPFGGPWVDEAGDQARHKRLEELRDLFYTGANVRVKRVHRAQFVKDGKVFEYVEVGGTWYKSDTAPKVVSWLETFRARGKRVTFCLGDKETGRDWQEIHDVSGYIGRTMGPMRSPILLKNSRSTGGGIILTDHIVLLRYANKKEGPEVYRHPNYHLPTPEELEEVEARYAHKWSTDD